MIFKCVVIVLTLMMIRNVNLKQCFLCYKDLCHSWYSFDKSLDNCNSITKDARLIMMNGFIRDRIFVNSQIRMIQNSRYVALSDCAHHKYFLYFFKENYTPIIAEKAVDDHHTVNEINPFTSDKPFQMCLEDYCTLSNANIQQGAFICHNNRVEFLDMKETRVITHQCLQSITYAFISSTSLIDINTSAFFKYAIRLIKLKLEFPMLLRMIKCDLFKHLTELRILELSYLHRVYSLCFFDYNPKLILISNQTARVWNMCNDTYDFVNDFMTISDFGHTTTTSVQFGRNRKDTVAIEHHSIIIVCILLSVILLACFVVSIIKYNQWWGSQRQTHHATVHYIASYNTVIDYNEIL